MARYRTTEAIFVDNHRLPAGREFESDAEFPGRTWEPLDDEAKARVEALPAERIRRGRTARFVQQARARADAKQKERAERLVASKSKPRGRPAKSDAPVTVAGE